MASRRWVPAAGLVVALAGLVLRFLASGPLWLDEALSVEIATLPYGELTDALRHDGSPPFYYLLLHWWIDVFGDGPLAARALSGVVGAATVPAVWAFANEVTRSRRVATIAALVLATSPFAIRYGAEARMYALVQLLVALGGWALVRYVRGGTPAAGVGVAVCSGLLALTHYWSFYLLAAVGIWLLRRRRWRPLVAVLGGGVLFLPWLPSFVFQLTRTGTPWARRPPPGAVVQAVVEWSGTGPFALFLFALLGFLALVGAAGEAADERRVVLDLRGRRPGRTLAAVAFGALLLGVAAGLLLGSGYAARYSAVAIVPFVVLVAIGAATLPDERTRIAVVGAAAVLGVVSAIPGVFTWRTQAGVVAEELRGRLGPRDVVVYCPDQLGPAVSRLLPDEVRQEVFPSHGRPERVDWVDYAERNTAADPVAFADDVLRRHPDGTVWLVVAGGYRTFGNRCDVLTERLRAARDERVLVRSRGSYVERMSLVGFAP